MAARKATAKKKAVARKPAAKKAEATPPKTPTAAQAKAAAREAALAIIEKINRSVAASVGFQGIVDRVGDELREIFRRTDLTIRWYDGDFVQFLYAYEKGRKIRIAPRPRPSGPKIAQRFRRGSAVLLNSPAEIRAFGIEMIPGTARTQSFVAAPMLGASGVIGSIILENYERKDAYGKDDVQLLKTIAASLGAALENARLFEQTQRLLKETEQRAAELAVINSIQQGMAASLDFQSIIDLVGDTLREVFAAGNIGSSIAIRWWDEATGLTHWLYAYEHGKRHTNLPPVTAGPKSATLRAISTREPQIVTTKGGKGGGLQGTDRPKSMVLVPIIGSAKVLGTIQLEDHERQHAFGPAQVRLLTTVAASMGVALESARNFAETQRLLKETAQQNAELAVINSIQQGISASLDFQAIIDLVGDKLREVFQTGDLAIRWWDEAAGTTHWLYAYEHGITRPGDNDPAPPQ